MTVARDVLDSSSRGERTFIYHPFESSLRNSGHTLSSTRRPGEGSGRQFAPVVKHLILLRGRAKRFPQLAAAVTSADLRGSELGPRDRTMPREQASNTHEAEIEEYLEEIKKNLTGDTVKETLNGPCGPTPAKLHGPPEIARRNGYERPVVRWSDPNTLLWLSRKIKVGFSPPSITLQLAFWVGPADHRDFFATLSGGLRVVRAKKGARTTTDQPQTTYISEVIA
jgi:hypothetical protein